MVRDGREVRPLRNGEQDRVTGFLLCGEGYGDMICMIPTVEKTARQLGRTLDVWTKRPKVFANIPSLRPRMSDDSELKPYLAEGGLLIVCPVRFDQSPKWNQAHLAIRPAGGIVQLDDADKEVRLYTTTEDRATATRLLEPLGAGLKAVIHPNRNRPIRTWPSERWRQLALGLLELDVGVVAVGRDVPNLAETEENVPKGVFDLRIAHDRFLDLTGRTSLPRVVRGDRRERRGGHVRQWRASRGQLHRDAGRGAVQRQRPGLFHPHPRRQAGRRHGRRPPPLPDAVLPNMARGMERVPAGR